MLRTVSLGPAHASASPRRLYTSDAQAQSCPTCPLAQCSATQDHPNPRSTGVGCSEGGAQELIFQDISVEEFWHAAELKSSDFWCPEVEESRWSSGFTLGQSERMKTRFFSSSIFSRGFASWQSWKETESNSARSKGHEQWWGPQGEMWEHPDGGADRSPSPRCPGVTLIRAGTGKWDLSLPIFLSPAAASHCPDSNRSHRAGLSEAENSQATGGGQGGWNVIHSVKGKSSPSAWVWRPWWALEAFDQDCWDEKQAFKGLSCCDIKH